MEQQPSGDPWGDIPKQHESNTTPANEGSSAAASAPAPTPTPAPVPTPGKPCPACGTANPALAVFCNKCGLKLPDTSVPSKKVCIGCGAENSLTAEYCYKCGLKLPEKAVAYQPIKYGGFWVRLLSAIIDSMILGVFASIINTLFFFNWMKQLSDPSFLSSFSSTGKLPASFWTFYWVSLLVSLIVQIAYNTIAVGKWGKTLGKTAVGLKVVKADGGKVSYARALGRTLAYQLNSFTFGLSFLVIAFSAQKRGIHDYIADTIVIKTS